MVTVCVNNDGEHEFTNIDASYRYCNTCKAVFYRL